MAVRDAAPWAVWLLLGAACGSSHPGPGDGGARDAEPPEAGAPDGGVDGGLSGPSCPDELDPGWHPDLDGLPPRFLSDGLPDAFDTDSDGDGVPDAVEATFDTDPCDWDSDDDGVWDVLEVGYATAYCPGGPDEPGARGCGCATDPACLAPEGAPVAVAPRARRTLAIPGTWSTRIPRLDLFLLLDGTGWANALGTVRSGDITGMHERLSPHVDVLRIGAGRFEDFPLLFYGSGGGACSDTPFALIGALRGDADGVGALDGLFPRPISCGGSAQQAQTEALYQAITGGGGTWAGGDASHTVPGYASDCEGDRFGAPCFAPGALPVIALATGSCSHAEPPGGHGGCNDYRFIVPRPATWETMVAAMTEVGAKVVGLNSRGIPDCDDDLDPVAVSPCHFLRTTAERTGAVTDGGPVVSTRDRGGGDDWPVAPTVEAARRLLTDVRYDVTVGVGDDGSDPDGVDARDLVRLTPACEWMGAGTSPPGPDARCWTAAPGTDVVETVRAVDAAGFDGVLPGGDVTFTMEVPGVSRRFAVHPIHLQLQLSRAAIGDPRRWWIVTMAP